MAVFPPGSRYFGNMVMCPVTALSALNDIVLAKERRSLPGLTLISKDELPEMVEEPGIGKQNYGMVTTKGKEAKIRISYVKNGIPIEE